MIVAKSRRTYSKWLMSKEDGELKYNGQKFVKGATDSGKMLLLKILRNNVKSRNQRLIASNRIAKGGEENCADATGGQKVPLVLLTLWGEEKKT